MEEGGDLWSRSCSKDRTGYKAVPSGLARTPSKIELTTARFDSDQGISESSLLFLVKASEYGEPCNPHEAIARQRRAEAGGIPGRGCLCLRSVDGGSDTGWCFRLGCVAEI